MSTIYDEDEGDWDHDRQRHFRGAKFKRPTGPGEPHIMNKAERKELARICQRSGLSEEEVRGDLTHRRALAKAQHSMNQPKDPAQRQRLELKRRRRDLAKKLGVPFWSPELERWR